MKKDTEKIAKKFGIFSNIQKLEKDLLAIDNVTDVDFDLNGFYDNLNQVIFLVKYNIQSKELCYFIDKRKLTENIIETAKQNGLSSSGDAIEDYDTWLYFVRTCNEIWKPKTQH